MDPLLEILLLLGGVIAGIILLISVFKVHPAISLALAAVITGILLGLPAETIASALFEGFVNVLAGVGIIIILGAILGILMEHSGALNSIIAYIVRIFGPDRPVISLSVLGLFIGIPVFCDSGFIILSKVANNIADLKKLPRRTTAVALGGGLYAAHTLIPPTPGPVAAAGNLQFGDHLGLVLISGLLVSVPVVLVLILTAGIISKKGKAEAPIEKAQTEAEPVLSLLFPVILAILLIAAGSFIRIEFKDQLSEWVMWIFHPITALALACLIAYFQINRDYRSRSLITKGLKDALPSVLITCMGGAFGQVLRESSLITVISDMFDASGGGSGHLLLIGFIAAVIIKSAQGSSTAAIVIASSLVFPLTEGMGVMETALLISAIGSGSMAVSHANDSYFWVVSRFSGMSVRESYTYFSLTTLLLAITGFAGCWLLLQLV
ncbi:MAG: GntP family permease [Cyclobacteriaceae bacterium]